MNEHLLASIQDFVIAHAPYKQIDPASATPNAKIGRSPALACEVMRYLALSVGAARGNPAIRRKLYELADWVIGLQVTAKNLPNYGAVPSTPDLTPPANQYDYAIDSAMCADAMIRLFMLSRDARHLTSA